MTWSSFESLGLRAPMNNRGNRKTAEIANNFRITTDYDANQAQRLTGSGELTALDPQLGAGSRKEPVGHAGDVSHTWRCSGWSADSSRYAAGISSGCASKRLNSFATRST